MWWSLKRAFLALKYYGLEKQSWPYLFLGWENKVWGVLGKQYDCSLSLFRRYGGSEKSRFVWFWSPAISIVLPRFLVVKFLWPVVSVISIWPLLLSVRSLSLLLLVDGLHLALILLTIGSFQPGGGWWRWDRVRCLLEANSFDYISSFRPLKLGKQYSYAFWNQFM